MFVFIIHTTTCFDQSDHLQVVHVNVYNYTTSITDREIVTITNSAQQREYQHTCKKEIFKLHHILHTYPVTTNSTNSPQFYTYSIQNYLELTDHHISQKTCNTNGTTTYSISPGTPRSMQLHYYIQFT